MSGMDHAAAHERIGDLLLDPRRLAELDASTAPEDVALREHVAGCATCRAELGSWRDLGAAISSSLPRSTDLARAATEPVELPPSLRATVLAAVRSEPRGTGIARSSDAEAGQAAGGEPTRTTHPLRSRSRLAPLLAMAAALLIVVGSAFVVVDQAGRNAAAESENAALTTALAAVNRVLAEPKHVVVQLHQPDGTSAGSISWSRHDWVVITNALARPAANESYLCWLEDGGKTTLVGSMQFAGDTAFWVASVDKWATWEITATTKFIVTRQPAGGTVPEGSTLLEAALGA
jgi:hypothetical protein